MSESIIFTGTDINNQPPQTNSWHPYNITLRQGYIGDFSPEWSAPPGITPGAHGMIYRNNRFPSKAIKLIPYGPGSGNDEASIRKEEKIQKLAQELGPDVDYSFQGIVKDWYNSLPVYGIIMDYFDEKEWKNLAHYDINSIQDKIILFVEKIVNKGIYNPIENIIRHMYYNELTDDIKMIDYGEFKTIKEGIEEGDINGKNDALTKMINNIGLPYNCNELQNCPYNLRPRFGIIKSKVRKLYYHWGKQKWYFIKK